MWPTPVAQDDNKTPEAHMAMKARMKGGPRQTCTSLQVMVKGCARGLWPTPNAADGTGGPGNSGRQGGLNLRTAVARWPTPRATDGAKGGPNQRGSKGDLTLPSAVHHWPTPPARDWRSGKASQMTLDSNSRPLNEVVTEQDPDGGGQLNPTWTEWLMGWPSEWTACAPLAMDGYHRWRQSLLDALHGR